MKTIVVTFDIEQDHGKQNLLDDAENRMTELQVFERKRPDAPTEQYERRRLS